VCGKRRLSQGIFVRRPLGTQASACRPGIAAFCLLNEFSSRSCRVNPAFRMLNAGAAGETLRSQCSECSECCTDFPTPKTPCWGPGMGQAEKPPVPALKSEHKGRSRTNILQSLRQKVARGQPIIGGGAGTGLSAKCEEAGGIDLIVIYNS